MFHNLLKLKMPLSKYNGLKIKVIFWYLTRESVECQMTRNYQKLLTTGFSSIEKLNLRYEQNHCYYPDIVN